MQSLLINFQIQHSSIQHMCKTGKVTGSESCAGLLTSASLCADCLVLIKLLASHKPQIYCSQCYTDITDSLSKNWKIDLISILRFDLTATTAADVMQNANLGQQRGTLIQCCFFHCE